MLNKFLFLALAVVFAAGCGVKAETYVMTKQRMDIEETAGGNAGYLMGPGSYKAPEKKTRQVYILEVSKPVPESEAKKIEEMVSQSVVEQRAHASAPVREIPSEAAPAISIPPLEDMPTDAPVFSGPKETVIYTVKKDDTLQKIAKEFYGSYSRWIKIYEANKDKLKNPNFVKPGTVLTIPAGE